MKQHIYLSPAVQSLESEQQANIRGQYRAQAKALGARVERMNGEYDAYFFRSEPKLLRFRAGVEFASTYQGELAGEFVLNVFFSERHHKAAELAFPPAPGPKAAENQWVFPLGGIPRAFLRVQYYVQPIAEEAEPDESPNVWGRVLSAEVEYLLEVANGAFTCIAEWPNVSALPLSLCHIEESGRPDYKALGWDEKDILAWLGDDE